MSTVRGRSLSELDLSDLDLGSTCAEGLAGIFCVLCADVGDVNGTTMRYVAATDETTAHCERCTSAVFTPMILLGLFMVPIVFFLVLLGLRSLRSGLRSERPLKLAVLNKTCNWGQIILKWGTAIVQQAVYFKVKIKIVIGMFLIVSKIGTTYRIVLPYALTIILDGLDIALGFGLVSLNDGFTCLGLQGYLNRLQFFIFTPIALCAFTFIVVAAYLQLKRQLTRAALLEATLPGVLLVLFFAYPLVTNTSTSAFKTFVFEGGEEWLQEDASVRVGTDAYHKIEGWAIAGFFIYPIGAFGAAAALLYRVRKVVQSDSSTALSRASAFLWQEYKPNLFWVSRSAAHSQPRRATPVMQHTRVTRLAVGISRDATKIPACRSVQLHCARHPDSNNLGNRPLHHLFVNPYGCKGLK